MLASWRARKKLWNLVKMIKENAVWWELFPVGPGDRVKIVRTGEIGTVVGVTIPCNTRTGFDPKVWKYLSTEYKLYMERSRDEKAGVFAFEIAGVKRWEIYKVGEDSRVR